MATNDIFDGKVREYTTRWATKMRALDVIMFKAE